ncbi:MAG TPA: hypothetical protein VEZ14_06630 [Dehalococcoidia bacterium]|nr:hypothetical protein [Dehalococcoidia bacterium]
MSKLAEKIRRATRLQAGAIGFGTAAPGREPSMVLVARTADAAAAESLARKGADAVILDARQLAAARLPKPAAGGAILGVFIGAQKEGESLACKEAGYDFVVFDPDTAAATALLAEEIGYVLVLPAGLGDSDMRALEGLQLDAIDVGTIDGALTVRRQLDLRRIYSMTRRALMATVRPDVSVDELQAIRDTNVAIVCAESAAGVEQLRKTIDALPLRRQRKDAQDRPSPLVPRAHAPEDTEDDEE